MKHVELSLKLETTFKSLGVDCTRDGFQNHPTQEIEHGLEWLYADGRLSKADFDLWRESCDCGGDDLKTAIDTFGTEIFENLSTMLSNLKTDK